MTDVLFIENMEIKKLVLGVVETNCYIITNQDTREALIVDPADEVQKIKDYLEQKKLSLVGIFLTHGHFDHILAVSQLAIDYHVKIYAHQLEQEVLEHADVNYSYYRNHEIIVKADIFLQNEEIVTLAGTAIKCIHTPGHTQGSACYYFMDKNFLLSGDTLFLECIGRTDLPTGSGKQLIESIKNKLFILDDSTLVLPGHGDRTTIGYEKKNNPYVE